MFQSRPYADDISLSGCCCAYVNARLAGSSRKSSQRVPEILIIASTVESLTYVWRLNERNPEAVLELTGSLSVSESDIQNNVEYWTCCRIYQDMTSVFWFCLADCSSMIDPDLLSSAAIQLSHNFEAASF